jgi:predicted ribosomally synthesized peptide with SipW-like signal peptide
VSKVKRLLVGMLIVGAITAATASGTFATFNASTTNNGTVTSGTLLLGNSTNSGAECISSDSGPSNTITTGNTASCPVLFSGSLNPTGSTSAWLTLKNEGNIPATSSSLTITVCQSTVHTITASNGHTFAGDTLNAPLCHALQLVIAEVSASQGSTLTGAGCIYGDPTVNTPLAACGYSNSFLADGTAGPYSLGSLAAGASKFYVLDLNFPDTNDNRLQGQNAAMTLTWTLNQ